MASPVRQFEHIQKAQIDFLEKLITTNAISFPDDKRNDAWTFGYYLQDAMWRLRAGLKIYEPDLPQAERNQLEDLLKVYAFSTSAARNRHQWERVHAVLRMFLQTLTNDNSCPPEPPPPFPGDEFFKPRR